MHRNLRRETRGSASKGKRRKHPNVRRYHTGNAAWYFAHTKSFREKQNGSPKAPDCLWWSEGDLNPRHADFQSAALPTELPDHMHQLRCELIVYRKALHRSSTNCSFVNAISHFTEIRRFEPHRRSSRASFRVYAKPSDCHRGTLAKHAIRLITMKAISNDSVSSCSHMS